MKKILLLIVFIFHLQSSFSQPNLSVINIGVGQMSCSKYVDYYNKNNENQLDLFVQWTWGFMVSYQLRSVLRKKIHSFRKKVDFFLIRYVNFKF